MGENCGVAGARRLAEGRSHLSAGVQHKIGPGGRPERSSLGAARRHGHQEQIED